MKFFVLHREVGVPGETWCSYLKPEHKGPAATCPACGLVVGSISSLPPYHIELKVHGSVLGDYSDCPGDGVVVSDRFHTAWERAQLRGLEFVPVERIRVRPARLGKKPLTYFHASPKFFGTHIDMTRSRFEHEGTISCKQCHYGGLIKSIRGMCIDEDSWTGEDLFYAWGLCGTVIVTDRVRQLRDEYGLTNVSLTPVEEFFWDPYNQWSVIDYSRDEPAPTDAATSPS